MSEPGPVRRYLASRKNAVGMVGAIAGGALHIAGLVGDVWPVVAAALYGAGALLTPAEPPEPGYAATVRADLEAARSRVGRSRAKLPSGVPAAIERMLTGLALVLDRLDVLAGSAGDMAKAPERLAIVGEIVSTSLPACLDTYLTRPPSSSAQRAAAALVQQLDVIARAVDRLVHEVPDVHADSAESLTEQLRRQYPG